MDGCYKERKRLKTEIWRICFAITGCGVHGLLLPPPPPLLNRCRLMWPLNVAEAEAEPGDGEDGGRRVTHVPSMLSRRLLSILPPPPRPEPPRPPPPRAASAAAASRSDRHLQHPTLPSFS